MAVSLNNPSDKAGLPPGTLVHVGRTPTIGRITCVAYSADQYQELEVGGIDEIVALRTPGRSLWVHCEGLDVVQLIEALGAVWGVHPLVLEDILNTHQRPKFEAYDDYLFFVLKTLRCDHSLRVQHEQISLLLFADVLITFRETADDLFTSVRQRLANVKGRLRTLGTDYLAYVILDAVVDNYFNLTDVLEDAIEEMEGRLLDHPQPPTFARMQLLKRNLVFLRKAISPLREVLLAVQHCEDGLIEDRCLPYFRDVLDHTLRVMDTVDSYRDLLNGMLDIYLSSVSNRLNEIMKVLTTFATVFIPLTFIAGVYGMNFDDMPELHWRWAYPALWGVFLAIPMILLSWFRRRKWL